MDETLSTATFTDNVAPEAAVPCLTLLWSRDEPERVGEVALLDPTSGSARYVLGRGRGPDADECRLSFARVRAGERDETGPLRSSKISRRQLRFEFTSEGSLEVENLGRGSLAVNGEFRRRAVLRPGDLVELSRRLLLLVSSRQRPRLTSEPLDSLGSFAFGCADPYGFVGESPLAWELRSAIQFVARREYHVLILGPSGTGKELVAQAIHALSRRVAGPFVSRNAATIPESLVDAELFGNVRDYPNPGMRERPGLLGEADRGSLFLDEIGELPHTLQAHLLRVMDLGEYQRLGDAKRRTANVRVLAATNRSPDELKHDLRARFALSVTTHGLGERREDIPLIARHLITRALVEDSELALELERRSDRPVAELQLSMGLVKYLVGHRYQTHVREIGGILWQALAEYEPPYLRVPSELRAARCAPPTDEGFASAVTRTRLEAVLRSNQWVLESTWRELGLRNRHQLRRLMDRHGLEVPQTHVDPATLSRAEVEATLARCSGVKERAWRELGLRNRHQLNRLLKRYESCEP